MYLTKVQPRKGVFLVGWMRRTTAGGHISCLRRCSERWRRPLDREQQGSGHRRGVSPEDLPVDSSWRFLRVARLQIGSLKLGL